MNNKQQQQQKQIKQKQISLKNKCRLILALAGQACELYELLCPGSKAMKADSVLALSKNTFFYERIHVYSHTFIHALLNKIMQNAKKKKKKKMSFWYKWSTKAQIRPCSSILQRKKKQIIFKQIFLIYYPNKSAFFVQNICYPQKYF